MPVVVNAEKNVQARVQQCGNCGGMTLYSYTTYGKWYLIGQQRCNKQWNLSDDIYERTVTKKFRCSKCGYETINSTYKESKVVCNH